MRTKPTGQVSRKTTRKTYGPSRIIQNTSRNRVPALRDLRILERVKINLGHLVTQLSAGGKKGERKRACEDVAIRLSALAGLNNGHVWSWKYIAAICSGSLQPSQKFINVFELYSQHLKPRQKQWFYFVRRRSVAAVYDKSILAEIIRTHLRGMGYKAVTYSRYMQIKHAATKKGK